jgi:hypothetical protein
VRESGWAWREKKNPPPIPEAELQLCSLWSVATLTEAVLSNLIMYFILHICPGKPGGTEIKWDTPAVGLC